MDDGQQAVFGSKYILEEKIGTGGMAEVFRARLLGREGFEKSVVLKKLQDDSAKDPEIKANFINEARLAAFLQHENIVQVYDFGEAQGSLFIAMEYLVGWDLSTVLRKVREREELLPLENTLFILSRVCEAMEYAHGLKDLNGQPLHIIHRDLSPQNIFITRDGKIKVIDFGIARAELSDNRTKVGLVKGKVSYMSPEQLLSDDIDCRSDIFTIGILLYEMLSGSRMYSGDTATLIRKAMEADFQPLAEKCPELEPSIYSVVGKALARNKDERYQSCGALQADLEECLFQVAPRMGTKQLQTYMENIGLTVAEPGDEGRSQKGDDASSDLEKTVVQEMAMEEATRMLEYGDSVSRVGGARRLFSALVGLLVVGLLFLLFLPRQTEIPEKPAAAQVKKEKPAVKTSPAIENKVPPIDKTIREVRVNPVQVIAVPKTQKPKVEPKKKEIARLLQRAAGAMSSGRYTRPTNDCAFAYYTKVLALEPTNNLAKDGLRQLSEKYAEFTEEAIAAGDLDDAEKQLLRGFQVAPDSERLLALKRKILKERATKVRDLLILAERALQKDDLITPPGDCSYAYFKQVLNLNPESGEARRGMRAIADRYAVLAEDSFRNLRLGEAKQYVKNGLKVMPKHSQLLELKKDLARSKPGIFMRSLEKSFGDIVK